jgi:predicted ATPase
VVTSDVPYGIAIAEEKGLIQRYCAGWRFVHDQIQQSAYSLIPEHERGEVHLHIGRKLWSSLDTDELGLNTFLVVNQLRHGAHLMTDQGERERMAVLLLRAGEKATTSSAFQNAASHLNLGVSMLENRHWRDQYHLSLDLTSAAAEYCNANFDRMDELINEVLKNARCTDDKTRALTTSIYSLGSRNEVQKALDLGFKVLADLGEPFPTTAFTLTTIFELMKTKRMLRKLSDDDILNLPRMYDTKLAAMSRIMIRCSYSGTGAESAPLIAFRLVQTSVSHGYGMCI